MPKECSPKSMSFVRFDGRAVVADFGGGAITSDTGALLLGAIDRAIRLVERFAACFSYGRMPGRLSHDVATLVGQCVSAIAHLERRAQATRCPRHLPSIWQRSVQAWWTVCYRSRGGAGRHALAVWSGMV